jgi:ppGpp synthetase/RelA/SpoT-type nucleotidyltranferase
VSVDPPSLPSKSQLKAAGDRIRRRFRGELVLDGYQSAEDSLLVKTWRVAHTPVLNKTRVGLGATVARVLGRASTAKLVSQRLKRYDSIVAKLIRAQTRLGEIEDIAGCRGVLPDLDAVRRVHERLVERTSKLELVRVRDYNEMPHPGGYRALHLWCRRDDFKVEIQLRTARQQDWAESVERLDKSHRLDLKHEKGPDELLVFFRELANYYGQRDCGVAHSEVDVSGLHDAGVAAEAWLARRPKHA